MPKLPRSSTSQGAVEITLWGKLPAKKNSYRPRRFGKGRGMYKDEGLQTELDRLAVQIPAECRDLNLLHPDLDVTFWVLDRRSDRDNMLTTLLDLLKDYGVIRNDSIAQCNGTVILRPAIICDHYKTVIILTKGGSHGANARAAGEDS